MRNLTSKNPKDYLLHQTGSRQSPRKKLLQNSFSQHPQRQSPRKKNPASPNGKKKLDFHHAEKRRHIKPLCMQKFYLDFLATGKLADVKKRIEKLGGSVEEFLSREVTCVLTTKKTDSLSSINKGKRSSLDKYKASPSPYSEHMSNPQLSSNRSYFHVYSPMSTDSPGSIEAVKKSNPNSSNTRGQALLQRASHAGQKKSLDLVSRAQELGANVQNVYDFLQQFSNDTYKDPLLKDKRGMKPSTLLKSSKSRLLPEKSRTLSETNNACSLMEPFLKIEDQRRCFRPVYQEFRKFPKLYLNSSRGSCPYDPPSTHKQSRQKREVMEIEEDDNEEEYNQDKETTGKLELASPQQMNKTTEKPTSLKGDKQAARKEIENGRKDPANERKDGYCECCTIRYDDIQKHLRSEMHLKFAKDASNFAFVDSLIQGQANFSQFMQSISLKKQSETPSQEPLDESQSTTKEYGWLEFSESSR